jgi:hypothetical protein
MRDAQPGREISTMERGPSEMRLDQAIDLLRGRPGSIESLGPEFVQRARACAVLADGVRDGAVLTKPLWPATTPTPTPAPARTHDAAMRIPATPRKGGRMHIHIHAATRDAGAEAIERGDAEGIAGAQEATRTGAKLVQRLPGPVTAYFIAADGDGKACLYQTADADNALDPGAVSIKSKTLTGDQRRAVARDAARSKSLLAGMNAKNRAFWASR